ncbi:C39 family peptidase [Salinisphaera aquimarina]|uniref:C39 family peptidase n=1 Tax=Salinisphaera aquimarina TaxID=2094031 RepID=A0ABV7ENU7_9GAMM
MPAPVSQYLTRRLRSASRVGVVFIAITVMMLCTATSARAGQLNMLAGGLNLNVPVQSFKERRFSTVMKQRYDYSCGSAALASLLTYHYDDRVTEVDVFKSMFKHGDQPKIKREGFSLLDMKQYLNRRGYSADGYRVALDKLVENSTPAIVLLNHDGYLHFVMIKGVTKRQVLVGDPAVGIRVFPRQQFESMWNGVVFVIRSYRDMAKQSFNRRTEWNLWANAPVGQLPASSLASFTMLRPLRNDF